MTDDRPGWGILATGGIAADFTADLRTAGLRVAAVGSHVRSHKPGDLVGVGCIVDSCRGCDECADGLENYCDGMVGTYNSPTPDAPGHTLGGYSQAIVVHERYVLKITHPEDQLAAVAPAGTPADQMGFQQHHRVPLLGEAIGDR